MDAATCHNSSQIHFLIFLLTTYPSGCTSKVNKLELRMQANGWEQDAKPSLESIRTGRQPLKKHVTKPTLQPNAYWRHQQLSKFMFVIVSSLYQPYTRRNHKISKNKQERLRNGRIVPKILTIRYMTLRMLYNFFS